MTMTTNLNTANDLTMTTLATITSLKRGSRRLEPQVIIYIYIYSESTNNYL
jgi:hypothetical protein